MSIKIYEAYRLKEGIDLWQFLKKAKDLGTKEVKKKLTDLYLDFEARNLFEKEIRDLLKMDENKPITLSDIQFFIHRKYYEQLVDPKQNFFHFDVSFTIREHEGRFYFIPSCGGIMKDVLAFFKNHEDVESFHYWDNTDPDENVESSQWYDRGDIWAEICDNWEYVAVVPILDKDNLYLVDPFMDLLKERYQKKETK